MMMAMTSLALDHHGYGLTLISVSVSLHVVGMFGFSIPFGRLSDRIGRRNVMLLGNVIIAVGSILVPTSPDYLGHHDRHVPGRAGLVVRERGVVGAHHRDRDPAERGRAIGVSDTISQASTISCRSRAARWSSSPGLPALAVVALAVLAVPVMMLARLREPSPGRVRPRRLARRVGRRPKP